MSGVATAASVASVAISAYGAVSAGQAQASSANSQAQNALYQGQVARNNQAIANQQADSEIEAGTTQAMTQSLAGAATAGAIRARGGASGVDVNTGTSVDVQASQRQVAQLDTETVMNNSQRRAYGYRSQAVNFGAQSGLDTTQASLLQQQAGYDTTSGYLKAGGTLLSSASSLPTNWLGGGVPADPGSGSGYTGSIAYSGGDYAGVA